MGDLASIEGGYQHSAIHRGNPVQRFWHQSKLQLIDTVLKPSSADRILDVGCGSGVCSAHLAEYDASVLGIDGNRSAIEFANSTYQSPLLEFRCGYVDELVLSPGSFNKAICFEVVEHLYLNQILELLERVRASLVERGLLLITTPNYRSLWPVIEVLLDLSGAVPRLKNEQHVTRLTHKKLRNLCERTGFELLCARSICTFGPWFAPISRGLAQKLTTLELARAFPGGTVLAHLYRKR